ncbi:MAG: MerR family transcriptional regulator [Actinomyces sp.]|nr:MerR family transcriptional regulator [Actinomyces sp.]MCI1641638.1 MerR family transcriptional regulator [Actinomyces sp.]MCI1661889.1 MerR family transcriptional regulator [Actinomyces sp.]MCI1690731.1 MerR family transcriptional regulator [Actinomyces sp.]MCI1787541.1 MerR family transcriptional regulator [Actinomyces sp.]MCI1829189.1 MerR family transcriptional regulator [Actinomyces sp.]
MARERGGMLMPEVPLSVTAVSARLGVSASTLRTWERRYGLGPGERRAGAHRRYRPEDVERLARMVELIHSGVGAGDAAASALAMPVDVLGTGGGQRDAPSSPGELARAARGGDARTVRQALAAAIASKDLPHVWSDLIAPAMESVLADSDGDRPGAGSSVLLMAVAWDVLRETATLDPPPGLPAASRVVVLTDLMHTLPAHVVGVSLERAGVPTTILATDHHRGMDGARRFEEYRDRHPAPIAVVMGAGTTCESLLSTIAADQCVDVVLVGADAPAFLDVRVQRVRTVAACVEETVALARATAAAEARGGAS